LINIELSKRALINNLNEFRKLAPNGSVAPVLKSNAYGHGLFEIASILEKYRHVSKSARSRDGNGTIPFFVIDSYFEAVSLRSYGIKTPLLIIGYNKPETIMSSRLDNVAFTISSIDTLQGLEDTDHQIAIHLKIDTGMHRQGIMPDEIPKAIEIMAENPDIVLQGVCSHLSDADNDDPSFTEGQINIWNRLVGHLKNEFPSLKYTHLAATFGHRFTPDIDANVSRLGLGMYGMVDGSVFSEKLKLTPVLKMRTVIANTKKIKRDDSVGYSGTFTAEKEMTIATIPVGYYEGLDRRLSNCGSVQVGPDDVACKIVGNVSMNMASIDVSHVVGVKSGEKVTVFSDNMNDPNSIASLAKKCDLLPYEIAVHIPAVLRRRVVE
jgi:alanine racemase